MEVRLRELLRRTPEGSRLSDREFELFFYEMVLEGKIYKVLPYGFHQEYVDDVYVEICKRRPATRYNLCRKVVDDCVSLLFSESHFPMVDVKDDKDVSTRDALHAVIKHNKMNEVFMEAAYRGSVGSVAILCGVTNKQLYYQVLRSRTLKPVFDNDKTMDLARMVQQYPTTGSELRNVGYDIPKDNDDTEYWFRREWTKTEEIYYEPWEIDTTNDEDFTPKIDKSRYVVHNLGFVPIVWVKNLVGGTQLDGLCTFEPAIDMMFEADYQLSQGGRGLKYSSDPTLLIKAPSSLVPGEKIVKTSSNALYIPDGGDAALLEIAGTAAAAVGKHVENLRKFALEVIHGNRSDTDKLSVAQSGKAMEMMNQDLIWLADKLRTTYGEGGLVNVLKMTLKLLAKNPDLKINDQTLPEVNPNADIVLVWEAWYAYTPDDLQKLAIAITTLMSGGALSQETAVRDLASIFDIEDVKKEIARINAEKEKAMESAMQTAGQNTNNQAPGEAGNNEVQNA